MPITGRKSRESQPRNTPRAERAMGPPYVLMALLKRTKKSEKERSERKEANPSAIARQRRAGRGTALAARRRRQPLRLP